MNKWVVNLQAQQGTHRNLQFNLVSPVQKCPELFLTRLYFDVFTSARTSNWKQRFFKRIRVDGQKRCFFNTITLNITDINKLYLICIIVLKCFGKYFVSTANIYHIEQRTVLRHCVSQRFWIFSFTFCNRLKNYKTWMKKFNLLKI